MRATRRRWRFVGARRVAAVVVVVAVAVAAATALAVARASSGGEAAAAQISNGQLLYVVGADSRIYVYDIAHGNRLVSTLSLPSLGTYGAEGVVACPATGMLYISYGGQGGTQGNGSILAYDLLHDRVVWQHSYPTGAASIAITPDGRTIYMPAGEFSGSGTWSIVDAKTGALTGAVQGPTGAHNTIMAPDGRFVYLAGVDSQYIDVVSTATNTVVRKIGPLHAAGAALGAGRPFTINAAQTAIFTTSRAYLGFQVSSIKTGKVLYTVSPPGFTFDPSTYTRTPDHGISLSPDGRRLYLIDTVHGYVHVFDVAGLTGKAPRDVADIKLAHPPPSDGWLLASRNGRYVYVGKAGDVIDARTQKVVDFLPPLQGSANFLEIDWRNGRPVFTTNRYGIGYPRG